MNHPYVTMKLGLGSDKRNIDTIYPISLFFAFGIYLVFDRYQKRYNSAVPFHWTHPEVSYVCFVQALSVLKVFIYDKKPADPTWEARQLVEPNLQSHLKTPELLPVMAEGRQWITSFDPATGLHIGSFLADNEEEIERKIKLAQQAQRTWKKTTFQQRRRVVRSLLKWLVDNQEVCARVACRDTGKTCQFMRISLLCGFSPQC